MLNALFACRLVLVACEEFLQFLIDWLRACEGETI
jgi:hypothetical protein